MTSALTIRLCAFFFIVYGLIPLTDAEDQVACINLEYAGPIREVIERKPTKLAEAITEAASETEEFALAMVGLAIDQIPVVGAMLSTMFDQLVSIFGGGVEIEDVYKSLKEEIDELKEYMDQEIEELKLDQIKKVFGTSRGGMLGYAKHCKDTYKDDPDDMSTCLENLRAMMVEQYHFFLPENDMARSYEQTLPLFRMYGQLFVDTVLDQIHVARKRSKNSQAAAHAQALITKVAEFKAHYLDSVKKILRLQIASHIMPPKDNPACAPLPQGFPMCVCTLAIGPSKFEAVDKTGSPTDKTKNFCVGIIYGYGNACGFTKQQYERKYAPKHAQAVTTYWKNQVGEIVAEWQKAANALKPMVEKHKRWALAYFFVMLNWNFFWLPSLWFIVL